MFASGQIFFACSYVKVFKGAMYLYAGKKGKLKRIGRFHLVLFFFSSANKPFHRLDMLFSEVPHMSSPSLLKAEDKKWVFVDAALGEPKSLQPEAVSQPPPLPVGKVCFIFFQIDIFTVCFILSLHHR